MNLKRAAVCLFSSPTRFSPQACSATDSYFYILISPFSTLHSSWLSPVANPSLLLAEACFYWNVVCLLSFFSPL